jgi:glycosyltransferase involved in cell wall biosynthesis
MSKLRILLVTDAVGGVWVYSLELARALLPLGIDTVLAVVGPSPRPEQLQRAGHIRAIDTGLPLEWLETDPGEIECASKALALIASREGVDVVQTGSAALLAGGTFEQPCVAVQHSCVATWWNAVKGTPLPPDMEWRRDLVARGLAKAEAIVAPTSAFAAATKEAYSLDRPVLAVHNGRSTQSVRALPQGDFVLAAGRLWDEGKNVRTLDRAAAQISIPFQAAGATAGPNGATVELDHLQAAGELSEERVRGLVAAKPIFGSAALYEPFGLSVLEAAQAGCALVLSDIPTHRELWEGAALFVDARDDQGFAEAISDLFGDRDKRNRLGKATRNRARRYSPDEMARAMADIYERVAEAAPHLAMDAA